MTYMGAVSCIGVVVGIAGVGANPAPTFAALGLVVTAGAGCALLCDMGASFLALVLLLVYLGGMVVVFAYSTALAAEPFPETWVDGSVMGHLAGNIVFVVILWTLVHEHWPMYALVASEGELDGFSMDDADTAGVALLYSDGGGLLLACAWVLLLALLVVLELTRGGGRGALRAV